MRNSSPGVIRIQVGQPRKFNNLFISVVRLRIVFHSESRYIFTEQSGALRSEISPPTALKTNIDSSFFFTICIIIPWELVWSPGKIIIWKT